MVRRDEKKRQTHQTLINAVLSLSRQGRTFSGMSLREITGEVHLAPATFYRHFKNMDQLGLELIDHIGLYLKSIFSQVYKMAIQAPHEHERRLDYLFEMVSENSDYWYFFINERSGGSQAIRNAIQREVFFLVQFTAETMQQISDFDHVKEDEDLLVFAEVFVHMSFCWALKWLDLSHGTDPEQVQLQQRYKKQAVLQLTLLYSGIKNWQ